MTAMLIPGLSRVSVQRDNTPRLEKLVALMVGPPRVPISMPVPAMLPATRAVPVNFWTLKLGSAVVLQSTIVTLVEVFDWPSTTGIPFAIASSFLVR